MNQKFFDEFKELAKKHGIQDDPKPGEGDGEGSGDGEGDKGESKIVADVVERMTDKIVKAISEKKDLSKGDEKSLLQSARTKIFTKWGGMREIAYPTDFTTLSKEEKIIQFWKALVYHRVDEESNKALKALVEGTDSEGGYLVPEEFRAEVFRVLPDMSVMRRLARVLPMSTDTLNLNTLTARPTAYWTAEYASKSTTSAEFGRVVLQPNDLVCLLPVTEQLLADANINMVQFITEIFAEAIAVAEDKAFFTGSGTGQPKGISQETLTQVDAGLNINFDAIIDLEASVPARVASSPGAAYVGSRYVKNLLRKVKDNDGNYIWRDGGASNNGEVRRLPDTLHGYPFHEQNDINQRHLYFGDWRYYIIGDRQAVSVRTTTEGGEAWRRNAMEIKAVERVDGKVVLTLPFAKIINA